MKVGMRHCLADKTVHFYVILTD